MSDKSANLFEAYIASGRRSMNAFQFAEYVKTDREMIKSVKFVPPSIGSEGFGRFDVELSSKHYEVVFD
ncbi:hypothetical protein LT697_00390 [Pseudomonas syringae pv. syringae]|uniref:hypothetical protein n=1 Tax=Pseudomonas syringae TaxID=317 RepID=UPI00200AAF18|nr:hypothetical protein [Pseudomonas syringae]MCK9740002.1 hypothetical protein [Pseudomonas syringae pv. syringae]